MPSALLWAFSAEIIFIIRYTGASADAPVYPFHRKGVKADGSCDTPSVLPLRVKPPSPRGRLQRWRATLRHCQKPSPWTDSPRPGRDVALATEWEAGGCERSEQTEGVSPGRGSFPLNPLSHRCAMPAPPKGGALFMLTGREQKAPPERKDFPRAGGRCRVATKGGIWRTNVSLRGFSFQYLPPRHLQSCGGLVRIQGRPAPGSRRDGMKRKEQTFHVSRPWAAAQPFGRRQLD